MEADHPCGGVRGLSRGATLTLLVSSAATAHRPFATRPGSGLLFDAAIAAVTLAGSLLLMFVMSVHGGIRRWAAADGVLVGDHREAFVELANLDWLGILLAVSASAPLLAWRRSAFGVFAAIAAASALLVGLGYLLVIPLGASAALYLLAASRGEGDPWTRRTTASVVALFGAFVMAAWTGHGSFPAGELVFGGLAFALAWFAGERTRLRREHLADLRRRAERAERDAERERRLAVAEERARIARDLHDSAGHAINVIAVRAGTARMRYDRDRERSHEALAAVEAIAQQTAAEIDQIVGALRDPGPGNGTVNEPPGLASVDTLIERHATAGLDVSLASEGTPRPLESALDQAAYRILQEALTNAARHGTGAARVALSFGEAELELEISNPVVGASAPRSNGGHGLVGMRERATLIGGSLEADRANGSFSVHARLPYGGHVA